MTHDELVERLGSPEWRDVEFKSARRAVPRNTYETVSAFANTEGGHLVFGVQERAGGFAVVGVRDVDKVQSDFLSTLRQRDKISTLIPVQEHLLRHEGSTILLFHIPEAHRSEKPVFLDGDIRRAFVRSGGSDLRLNNRERDRFLVDAANDRYDGQTVDLDPERALDEESVLWYRATYEARPDNRSYRALDDRDFFRVMGLLRDEGSVRRLTRAAVLLFGSDAAFAQLLPRPVVDCQRFARSREEVRNGDRWFDRVLMEDNLVRTWRALLETWYPRIAEHPFRLDPATFQRDDTPPDSAALREAMVNLLMHQDYSDHGRSAEILHDPHRMVFRNPGDAFAPVSELMHPGEKEARNPRIVRAFRRIGLSENAGWGLRDVFGNWRELDRTPPWIRNSRRRKRFELILPIESLRKRQRQLELRTRTQLSEEETRILFLAIQQGEVSMTQMRATGIRPENIALATNRLVSTGLLHGTQGLVRPTTRLRHECDELSGSRSDQVGGSGDEPGHSTDQVEGRGDKPGHSTDQVEGRGDKPGHSTDQVESRGGEPGHSTGQVEGRGGQPGHSTDRVGGDGARLALTRRQQAIVDACHEPQSLSQLLARTGGTHRTHFRRTQIGPLLEAGILQMTNPTHPSARNQRYVLTEAGEATRTGRLAGGESP